MFRFDEGLKVYLHRDPVDFRMGINGLSILVEQAMRLNCKRSLKDAIARRG
ncbi:IS66 family insertion sequence element accessory protein TnpB [Burkholderia glumae]